MKESTRPLDDINGDKQTTQTPTAITAVVDQLPGIPRDAEGPVFAEPWEAEVFAMALSLHAKGVFTWADWAAQLHKSIQLAQQRGDPDLGDTYYSHWLDALETLIVSKQLGSAEQLAELYANWDTAARSTPHGQPIALEKASDG